MQGVHAKEAYAHHISQPKKIELQPVQVSIKKHTPPKEKAPLYVASRETGTAILEAYEKKMLEGRGTTTRLTDKGSNAAELVPPKEYGDWPDWKKKKWEWQNGPGRHATAVGQ